MNEHGYIKSVHRHIPKTVYSWKIHDNYAGGVADAFYCDTGGLLFCEYKYVPKPPIRPTTLITPKLSAIQLLWLNERYHQNVPVAVVLGTPLGGILFTALSWEQGITREQLENYALPPKAIASIICSHCTGKTYVTDNEQTYPHS